MVWTEALPWHAEAWDQLRRREEQGRLPHALLITGLPGLGKRSLARRLALTLLCERRGTEFRPCLQCRSCHLLVQGAHPDLFVVEPEERGKQIGIDQVRALGERLSLRSQYGRRLGLISPAEAMTVAAANALLKTLEEPPLGALLVLTSARPMLLPATIRSRCQQLALVAPAPPQAREWLRQLGRPEAEQTLGLAQGAPLQALQLLEAGALERWRALLATLEQLRSGRIGVVAAAMQWREAGRELIPLLQAVCLDLARLVAGAEARYDESGQLRKLAAGLDAYELHVYLEQLLEQRRHLEHALNESLVLESAFGGWLALVQKSRTAEARA